MSEHLVDNVEERAAKIKLLLMDCDGVLTDGRLYFTESGEEIKVFNVKDGQGMANWHEKGFVSGIISGRKSKAVERRANELGIKYVRLGSKDKVKDFGRVLAESNVSAEETAYIGDDLPDIPVLKLVGLAVSVADAEKILLEHSHLKTSKDGGYGAVREVIDFILNIKSLKLQINTDLGLTNKTGYI
jgi:3-deoxy-D-manno-octulosonate 8-phosphate phosphatase (KDO 8-P phosphatase)